MRSRMIHILLAIVVLTQSVASLAVAPAVSEMPATPESVSSVLVDVSENACHEEVAVAEAPPLKCCETMNDASCILSCTSVISAISLPLSLDIPDNHVLYPIESGYAAPHNTLSGLYRPPRIS